MRIQRVAIVGAGTMGLGIAQVCATAGYTVQLFDLSQELIDRAVQAIEKNLSHLVAKGKLTDENKGLIVKRIFPCSSVDQIKADLIIEAIVEKLEPKQLLFETLESLNPTAILASNTSTFPITLIAKKLNNAGNCIGLHFFNPAPVMKLVEIISGKQTNPLHVETVKEFCGTLDKKSVEAKDSPGFIVNRVARPYYVESLKVLEDGVASHEEIDQLLRASGFKMGPFELMDLIGVDTNLAVTTSLYNAFGEEPRFKPSAIQQKKVEEGKWGKKTGKGFYDYAQA